MAPYFHQPEALVRFSEEKMVKVNLYESPRMFCDVYCLRPGQEQKEHTHAGNDKIYYMLSGTCQARIGEEIRTLAAGQLAVAPAGMIHGVRNESAEEAVLLVIMAPHPELSRA
ncbi:MAG TPA: cupin domain-containing protein [bacterium]|nr:cupin domain-containing protein [bacterium]